MAKIQSNDRFGVKETHCINIIGLQIHSKKTVLFKMHEQKAFFEQKIWEYEKCSLNLQRSK